MFPHALLVGRRPYWLRRFAHAHDDDDEDEDEDEDDDERARRCPGAGQAACSERSWGRLTARGAAPAVSCWGAGTFWSPSSSLQLRPNMTRDEFATLALSYLEEVTAYARRLARSPWDADDLVQGAFEQAFRSWNDLAEPARCRAWLFRIARNLHIDRMRRASGRAELRLMQADVPTPGQLVAPETVERLTARELDAALARLPDDQREAVLLCDLWGFRYEEVAEIADVPVGTVRSRISRGRSQLAHMLAAGHRYAKSGGQS
jgi:RNA polymerase sigma-70 factor (ECF subfamily)